MLERLKHSGETPELPLPLALPYLKELRVLIESTKKDQRVFPYCPKTAYNIVQRAGFDYPHFFRMSRITNFFLEGWNIAQVRSWTGLTLDALEYYVGIANIEAMGKSLLH